MNIPPNTRPFDLSMAQQNHPLVTRAGATVKFIAYVPDAIAHHQLVIQVDDEVYTYLVDGTSYGAIAKWDVFLAPLGYVDGLPVFAGDKLVGNNGEFTVIIDISNLDRFKWPSKTPVVETRMTKEELIEVDNSTNIYEFSLKAIANKAIERAIADGDVIPTSLFVKMCGDTFDKWIAQKGCTFRYNLDETLKIYLESLK